VVAGNGTVQETRDYYPFGLMMPGRETTEATGAKEDYTGHERDTETGMHYAGARYYMSALGRWTTVDPILGKQSPVQLLREGKLQAFSMAPYNYSFNNPANLKDATGEWPTPWDVADFGFAALSIRDAWNDPSASNIGWAAADVAAAALPLVPSTRAVRAGAEFARQIAGRGPEAIRSIAAGAGKSEQAREFARAVDGLGDLSGTSVSSLKKLAIGTGRNPHNFILGPGSSARNFAERLTGTPIGEFSEVTSKKGVLKRLTNVELGGRKATVIARDFASSKGVDNTLEVQFLDSAGDMVERLEFRTDKF
jgi:RHS repeat-associated protein